MYINRKCPSFKLGHGKPLGEGLVAREPEMVDSVGGSELVLVHILAFARAGARVEAGVAGNVSEVSGSRQAKVVENFGFKPK